MNQEEIKQAIDEATLKYHLEAKEGENGPKLVTDKGTQFKTKSFKQFLRQLEVKQIRIIYPHPGSNRKIERFEETLTDLLN